MNTQTYPRLEANRFILVDHEECMAHLTATMRRVGASMTCSEFIRVVGQVYYEVHSFRHVTETYQYFRRSGAYDHFKRAVLLVHRMVHRPAAILDIGCGAGYELEVLKEVFAEDEVDSILCVDVSSDMLAYAQAIMNGYPCRSVLGAVEDLSEPTRVHLAVTHAMVHHVPNLASLFAAIDRLLVPGGFYVMGHEPNRRYWTHLVHTPKLRKSHDMARRRRQLRKFLQPSRYLNKLARTLGLADDVSPNAMINGILRERYGFTDKLSAKEIQRLVNVHIPNQLPGEFRIGWDGFDWNELGATMLPRFQLHSLVTYGHAMKATNPDCWPPGCQKLDRELAQQYPMDGLCFTAVWRKEEDK